MAELSKKAVILLVKSALTGERYELPDDIDFNVLYSFALAQNIVPLIYYGMINCKPKGATDFEEQFFLTTCQCVVLAEQQNSYVEQLMSEFDRQAVRYMPLKGVLLRRLYPQPHMRAMGDCDILIDVGQYDRIRPIMLQLGYTEDTESDHELIWHRDSVCIELHKRLIPSYNKDYYAYFGDGWNRARACGRGMCYKMSSEDELIYLITHFAKHYRDAGIGIRHLVDIKLYLDSIQLDNAYLEKQLKTLRLWEFFNNVSKTANVWFSGEQEDDATKRITEVIFSGGAFGTDEAHNMSSALKQRKTQKAKSRIARMFNKVFLPYKNMCLLFPFLKKVPCILPFLWVWRIIYTAFNKKGVLTKHYNSIKSLTPDNISQYESELNAVGLEYRFEEDD